MDCSNEYEEDRREKIQFSRRKESAPGEEPTVVESGEHVHTEIPHGMYSDPGDERTITTKVLPEQLPEPLPEPLPEVTLKGSTTSEKLDSAPPKRPSFLDLLDRDRKQKGIADPDAYLDNFKGKKLRAVYRSPHIDKAGLDSIGQGADIAFSLTPGINVLKDGGELLTGENAITGEPLGFGGRALSLFSLFGGSLGAAFKFGKHADEVAEIAEQAAKHGDEVAEAAEQAVKHGDEALDLAARVSDDIIESTDTAANTRHVADDFAKPVKVEGVASKKGYLRDFQSKRTVQRSGTFNSEGHARQLAREKLGKNPVNIGDNKWRSADGRWQYRAKPVDTTKNHVHLERLDPNTGEVLENWHLYWPEGMGR